MIKIQYLNQRTNIHHDVSDIIRFDWNKGKNEFKTTLEALDVLREIVKENKGLYLCVNTRA